MFLRSMHKWRFMAFMAPLLALTPFVRPHRSALITGAAAAAGVVILRLALPWPFRMVLEPVLQGSMGFADAGGAVAWPESSAVWMAATAFCLLVAAVGWTDHWERLNFARFAIGLVRNLRARAFSTLMRAKSDSPPGDLVARLVGDTARIKAGLKGFLVHVATNLLMFLGVVIILLWIDLSLGLVFAIAGSLTIAITLIGATCIHRCARRQRRKEGKIADAIHAANTTVISEKELSRINRTSERYEARVTRLQGRTTWAAHTILGLAVVGALLVGWHGFAMGRLTSGDLFICMAYMLMLRAPLVQLTRQGARTGKIAAALERVMALIEDHAQSAFRAQRPPPTWRRLRLNKVKIKAPRRYGRRHRLGPVDLAVERGEHIAIVGPPGAGKSTLLAMIAGKVRPQKGSVEWETHPGRTSQGSRETSPDIAFSPQSPVWNRCHLGRFLGLEPMSRNRNAPLKDFGLNALMKRLPEGLDSRVGALALSLGERKLVSAAHVANSGAAIKLLDDPAALLSQRHGSNLVHRILSNAAADTVLISFSRATAISAFNRIIKLRRGRIVFDGPPDQWRPKKVEKEPETAPVCNLTAFKSMDSPHCCKRSRVMKKAIILAAGRGSRLQPAAGIEHKALVPLGGEPLIKHQIRALRSAGIASVSVVVGHAADRIRAALGNTVAYIHNPRYAQTNSLYSLWMALNHWAGPFVLLNCDVLFHPSILARLLRVKGSALAYDSHSGKESEQMKIALKDDYVTALAKDLPRDQVWGENIGLLKFDLRAARLLYHETQGLIRDGHLNQWAPTAVSAVSQLLPIRAVDVADLPWIEIDFPWDLKDARGTVCPAIPGCACRTDRGVYTEVLPAKEKLVAGHA